MTNKTKKSVLKPLVYALGAGIAISFAGINLANAADQPFKTDQLTKGYNLAGNDNGNGNGDKKSDGKCSGKDNGDKKKDGKCGSGKCSS